MKFKNAQSLFLLLIVCFISGPVCGQTTVNYGSTGGTTLINLNPVSSTTGYLELTTGDFTISNGNLLLSGTSSMIGLPSLSTPTSSAFLYNYGGSLFWGNTNVSLPTGGTTSGLSLFYNYNITTSTGVWQTDANFFNDGLHIGIKTTAHRKRLM